MRNSIKIVGILAAAAAATAMLMRRRADGTRMMDDIANAGKDLGDKLMNFGSRIKDRLMPDMKGPNGEDIFSDMYDRQYYMDSMNRRVYMEEA